MKGKMGFKGNSIKGFIVQHVEKAVLFGGGGLFLLSLTIGAFTHAGMPWDQNKLVDESSAAEQSMKNNKVPEDLGLKASEDYVEKVKELRIPVDGGGYQHEFDWASRLFDESRMREQPALFALEELRATAGWGAVPVNPRTARSETPPASSTQGVRWIVLTGLIPLKEQTEAYELAFADAYRDPVKDLPAYAYYRIERAEVDPADPNAEPQWKRIHVANAIKSVQLWAGQHPEIVHPMFIPKDGPMVFPLPPVENRSFGAEVAHEPAIPLVYVEETTDEVIDAGPEINPEDEDVPEAVRGFGRPSNGGYGEMGGYMSEDEGGMEMDYGDEMGEGMGSYGGGYSYAGSRTKQMPDAQLFRFFDFNVESGKRYRYRVQLMLNNPNHDIPPEFLAKEELRDEEYLSAEFSDPCDVVAVPLDTRVLAVSVSTSLNLMVEPSAHLMTVYFDGESGEEYAAEHEKVYRGQVGNFKDIPVEGPETTTDGMYGMMGGGEEMDMEEEMGYGMGGPTARKKTPDRRARRKAEPEEEVETKDHFSEQTLLDMWGGERLRGRDRDLTEPGMMLLLDSFGQLVVRAELDDLEEYMLYYVPEAEPAKTTDEQMMEGYGEYGEDFESDMEY